MLDPAQPLSNGSQICVCVGGGGGGGFTLVLQISHCLVDKVVRSTLSSCSLYAPGSGPLGADAQADWFGQPWQAKAFPASESRVPGQSAVRISGGSGCVGGSVPR